jgi:hypothetical protein
MVIVVVLTMVIGATMSYVSTHYTLETNDARTEAALHEAEAGINDEIQYIAKHVGDSSSSTMSSQPTVASGQTLVSPFTNAVVLGRRGTVDGLSTGNFWVYTTSTNPSTGGTPAAWDGTNNNNYWVVSTGYVYGAWRRVYVKIPAGKGSIFNLHAIVALAAYQNSSNAIGLQNATVTITGAALTNGQVSNSSSVLVASNGVNANTVNNQTGQFDSSNIASGGTLFTQSAAEVYPTVTTVLSRDFGKTWAQLAASNSNATGIYTFNGSASDISAAGVSPATVQQYNPGMTMLTNQSTGGFSNTWSNAVKTKGNSGSTFSITGATNATPIAFTVASGNIQNGDHVTISDVVGNTGANNTTSNPVWTVSKSGSTLTLTGSTGTGTYTSGGTLVEDLQIASIGSNGTLVRITTSVNHGLSTGNYVKIVGTGTSLDNTSWGISVPSGNTGNKSFDLLGSTSIGSVTTGLTNAYIIPNFVKTLIFEPGDYFFTNIDVIGDASTQLIIDSQAKATGGTAGQVRFWVYNSASTGNQTDYINIPVKATLATGSSTPDTKLFRIYYGQDAGTFSFTRPSGFVDYDGSNSGFTVYGAVYAVTKQPGDTSSLTGTSIDFTGIGGSITLNGALIADKVTFHYICNIIYNESGYQGDPTGSIGLIGGYSDG